MEPVKNREQYFATDGDKRYLLEKNRGEDTTPQVEAQESVSVYNGADVMFYYPLNRMGSIHLPSSERGRNGKFEHMPSPFAMAGLSDNYDSSFEFSFDPLEYLNAPNLTLLSDFEVLDDSRCLVFRNPQGESILWLDADRGYAVKKAMLGVFSFEGIQASYLYNDTFQEIQSGLWVVSRGRIQWYGSAASEHEDYRLLSETIYEYSDVGVNEPLPDDLFEVPWPNGTSVGDFRSGLTQVTPYTWGGIITEEDLKDIRQETDAMIAMVKTIPTDGDIGMSHEAKSITVPSYIASYAPNINTRQLLFAIALVLTLVPCVLVAFRILRSRVR